MTRTRTRNDRIDFYRHVETGEIAPAHYIGETPGGYDLYVGQEGWEPVCCHVNEDGSEAYVATTCLQTTVDGNWYTRRVTRR